VAVIACVLVWLLIWRTRLGYEIRAFGKSEPAAIYAGISPLKITMVAMLISGGLAGLMAINNVMGEAERLVLNSVEGAGFIGIAVALMGRSHPFGVFLAAILFGFLYQGGAELSLWTSIPRELGRGDPGARDPLHRGARQHGADAAREALPRRPPRREPARAESPAE
jgi:general nucleoside transport system permease protein